MLTASRRTLAAGAAIVSLAVLAAGCGGSSSPGVASVTGANASLPAAQRTWPALYHCYATHGFPTYRPIGSPSVPSAPPVFGWYRQPDGDYAVTPAYQKLFSGPKWDAANKACEPLFPGKRETPAQAARDVAQMLKFAQCARAHGMRNLPDPDSGGLISLTLADYESPLFQRAENACKSLLKYGELFGIKFPPGWTPTNAGGS